MLQQIRSALEEPIRIRLAPPRFYALVTAKQPSFADQVKRWDLNVTPTEPPGRPRAFAGGGGIDLLQLLHSAIDAYHRRDVERIRARIDRELEALAVAQQ